MDTKWKNMVKAIKKFIKEYYDCVFGSLLFIIGSFLFFVVLVNRYYFSTWGVWRICLIGNILVQPGICLLVRRYMKLRYRNWSQKGIAETYLQDAEDSIYYQTWKAKENSRKKIPKYTGGRTVGSSGISFLYQLQQRMGMELCSRIYDGSNGVYRIYLLPGSDPEILEK